MKAPIVPKLKHPGDIGYFDTYSEGELPSEENVDPAEAQDAFEGF